MNGTGVEANAVGGTGGSGVGAGYFGGNGGSATATATGTGPGYLGVYAAATGGQGGSGVSTIPISGNNGPPATAGMVGSATASATATTNSIGGLALAGAEANGPSGSATAQAFAMGNGMNSVNYLTTIASTPAFASLEAVYSARTSAQAGSKTNIPLNLGFDFPENTTAAALGGLFPTASAVSTFQSGNPNNQAVFGPGGAVSPLAIGLLVDTSNGLPTPTSSQLTLELTQPVSGFTIGLLNPASSYTGPFNSLEFEVSIGGSTALDLDFANLAAANSYFTDNVLTFDETGQDVAVSLNLTGPSTGYNYAVNVEIGVVPEPNAGIIAALGMGLLGLCRLRRDRVRQG